MIKTVSLETAKALRNAGFKKECDFTWEFRHPIKADDGDGWELFHRSRFLNLANRYGVFSPTTDELLEELPKELKGNDLAIRFNGTIGWEIGYENKYFQYEEYVNSQSLCEAVAQMYLFLAKEGLL